MEGKGEALPAGLDEQAAQYRQRDRHDDPELGPDTERGSDLDPTTAGLDVGSDDIQPHPSPGHVGDKVGGGQPGLEGQLEKLLLAQALDVDALLGGLTAHAHGVDASAVVGHRNDDLGPQLHSVEADRPVGRFARRFTLGHRFDAVINRIANQVNQGIGELQQHAPVHLGIRAAGVPSNVLALRPRQVTHGALQLIGDGSHRNHLSPGRPVL